MSVKINIHVTHRQHTNGKKTIEVEGTTVGEALNDFVAMYPDMKKELFDKKGKLLNYIEIYLNKKSAYPGELEKKVTDGDEIQIITFLAGG
ncbi:MULTISPECIES: MoaD/ThiS family protein [Desulfobacula]|uniref:Molybdopterin converting factor, small subunit n=2 Tax=Desulfobacula TaxID=28222 RepID=A0A1H2JYW0_9BACT|nr:MULTISPECIES: MoaD/ThiS family protein [Desulfobacula]CCK81288.1 putative ThiS family protein [Desulfobacula toluolica Tol2]SDU61275.1 Molybdopterin converting factor, small subunit [Desulfobacula phenolica]